MLNAGNMEAPEAGNLLTFAAQYSEELEELCSLLSQACGAALARTQVGLRCWGLGARLAAQAPITLITTRRATGPPEASCGGMPNHGGKDGKLPAHGPGAPCDPGGLWLDVSGVSATAATASRRCPSFWAEPCRHPRTH